MYIRLTIFNQGLILVSVPFLTQLAFLGLFAEMQRSNAEVQGWFTHTKEVIAQTQVVRGTLVEAETSVRGLIGAGDPTFAQTYEQAARRFPDDLASLRNLVRDNPEQEARAAALAEQAAQLMDWLVESKRLDDETPRNQTALRDRGRTSRARLDDLRRQLSAFLQEEERLDGARRLNLERSQRQLQLLLFGGGVAAILSTGLLAFIFSRGISRRLAVLTKNAHHLGVGKELLPPVAGSDEIACVDRSFHRMAKELARSEQALREQARILQQLNEELEHRVAERTRELLEANRGLAQKNQENELFVYSVSHDLRSPLVNLEGFSEELSMVCRDLRNLLTDDGLPPSVRDRGLALVDADMAESIRFIRTGVRRLSNIIDGLLQLSRAGRVVYQFQHVEVSAIVARVVESMHVTIAERGATVRVADLPPIWGDAAAVEQIFANLIGNALNYLDPMRVGVIEIDSADACGEEGANGQPAPRIFRVKDNGLGIPAAFQAKVFQAFQRLHPAAAKGEGIGLSLVRRLVERLGGRIWFESTEGMGSTFFVSLAGLPAHEPQQSFRPQGAGAKEQEQRRDSAAVLDLVG